MALQKLQEQIFCMSRQLAVVLNYRDITERKRAEEEILAKIYFQQLFEIT
jgi:hypothetical protein